MQLGENGDLPWRQINADAIAFGPQFTRKHREVKHPEAIRFLRATIRTPQR